MYHWYQFWYTQAWSPQMSSEMSIYIHLLDFLASTNNKLNMEVLLWSTDDIFLNDVCTFKHTDCKFLVEST